MSDFRRPLAPDDLLYFMHIPKTAGTTFTQILRQQYEPWESFPHYLIETYLRTPLEVRQYYRLVPGHLFYTVEHYFPRRPVTITMLREPVDRTLSQFSFIKTNIGHPFRYQVAAQTLTESLTHPATLPRYKNAQTRYIALDDDPRPLMAQHSLAELKAIAVTMILEDRYTNDPDQEGLFQKARARLDACAFVGLAERFDDSLELLCYTLGWPPITEYERVNVTEKRLHKADLTPAEYDLVREVTQLDQRLYDYGRQLFEARFAQMKAEKAQAGA
jgi:hypothetical protein